MLLEGECQRVLSNLLPLDVDQPQSGVSVLEGVALITEGLEVGGIIDLLAGPAKGSGNGYRGEVVD